MKLDSEKMPAAFIIGGSTLVGSGVPYGWAMLGAGIAFWLAE